MIRAFAVKWDAAVRIGAAECHDVDQTKSPAVYHYLIRVPPRILSVSEDLRVTVKRAAILICSREMLDY